jgi:putative lipoic acid-binding regulatory protein
MDNIPNYSSLKMEHYLINQVLNFHYETDCIVIPNLFLYSDIIRGHFMLLDSENKPDINYPCEWSYRIIGTDVDKTIEAIENAVGDMKYSVTPSNISKNGKYYSLDLKLEVPNEVVRDLVYQKLADSDYIKIVL